MSDWVKNRGRCSLEEAFKGLMEVIKGDVEDINSLGLPEKKFDTVYLAEQGRPPRLVLRKIYAGLDKPVDQAMLALHYDREIHFYKNVRGLDPTSKLRVEWDQMAQACIYVLEGEESAASASLEDISRALLEPLFFGD